MTYLLLNIITIFCRDSKEETNYCINCHFHLPKRLLDVFNKRALAQPASRAVITSAHHKLAGASLSRIYISGVTVQYLDSQYNRTDKTYS